MSRAAPSRSLTLPTEEATALATVTCGSPTVVLTWLLVVIAVAVAWVITALLAITSPAFASPTALGHSCEMRAVTVT